MSARQPSRLRAALTTMLALLFRDGNVKKSAGRHRLRPPPTNARAPLNQDRRPSLPSKLRDVLARKIPTELG
jgi:hypothetical protein